MALIECKECKGDVSSRARICPKCGVDDPIPDSTMDEKLKWIVLSISFFVIIGIIFQASM